jgi:hypothetical protein
VKANLPYLFNHRLQLDLDENGHPVWAADRLTLREWGEWIKKRNRQFSLLPRMRADGALHTRVFRSESDRIEVDALKAPGRRYGPTPLRLLLPQEGRAARRLDEIQRRDRYARQAASQGRSIWRSFTPRQRRRVLHKLNKAVGRS